VVPAWIFYISLAEITDPLIRKFPVGVIAVLYALLGFSRLAYFTLDRSPIPGFFKGMPTPAAALLVTAPLVMFNQAFNQGALEWMAFWGVFSCVNMILTSVIMNMYPLRYLHVGWFMDLHPWFARINLLSLIVFIFTPYLGYYVLLCLLLYLISPLYTWRLLPDAVRETPDTAPAGAEG
jgi:phosphatidylserine synthase